LLIPRSAFAAMLSEQRVYHFPRADPEVVRLLRLQSLSAHRRDPPEPSLSLNLLQHIFNFLPVWIPPGELDALQELAESYAVALLQDSVLLAIHRLSALHDSIGGAVWPLDVEAAWRLNGSGTVFIGANTTVHGDASNVATKGGLVAEAAPSAAEPMDASRHLCHSCATTLNHLHVSYGLRQGIRRLSFRAGITFMLDSCMELVARYMIAFCGTIFSVGNDPDKCAPQLKHTKELTKVCEDLFFSCGSTNGTELVSDPGLLVPLAIFTDSESDEDDDSACSSAIAVNSDDGVTEINHSIIRTLEERRIAAVLKSGMSILGIRYYAQPRSLAMDFHGPMAGQADHEDNPCAVNCTCPINAGNSRVQVGTETFTVGEDTCGIISCCPLCAAEHRFVEFKCENTVTGRIVRVEEGLYQQIDHIQGGTLGWMKGHEPERSLPADEFTQRFVVDLTDHGAPVVANFDVALDRVARRAGMIGPAMRRDAKSLLAVIATKWVRNLIVYATESCYILPSEGNQAVALNFTHVALALGWVFRDAARSDPYSLHTCGPFRLCAPFMTHDDIKQMESKQLAQIQAYYCLVLDEEACSKAKQRLNDVIAVLQLSRGKLPSDDRTRVKRQKLAPTNPRERLAELLSSSRGVPPIPGATSGVAQCDPDLVKYITDDLANGGIDHCLYELDMAGAELLAWSLERYLETILACAVECAVHCSNHLNVRWHNDAEFRSEVTDMMRPARELDVFPRVLHGDVNLALRLLGQRC
jgi:histone H3/H4